MRRTMNDLTDIIKRSTLMPRNDNMLHFSQHLNHNRHTVLYYHYGYPGIVSEAWANTLPLLQGNAIHAEIHKIMDTAYGIDYYSEIPMFPDEGLFTYPWTGTADAFINNGDESWLIDYKTISGAGITFLQKPRLEHLMQVSCYYHFSGWEYKPDRVGILYLPVSADYKRRWHEPQLFTIDPMPEDVLVQHIRNVESDISIYQSTRLLPAWPEGEYKWKQNKRNKEYELHYKPHYSSMFCPWRYQGEDDPCGCSQQKPMLIGKVDYDMNVIDGEKETVLAYVDQIQEIVA